MVSTETGQILSLVGKVGGKAWSKWLADDASSKTARDRAVLRECEALEQWKVRVLCQAWTWGYTNNKYVTEFLREFGLDRAYNLSSEDYFYEIMPHCKTVTDLMCWLIASGNSPVLKFLLGLAPYSIFTNRPVQR